MSRIWSVAVCVFIVLLALVVYYGFFRKGIVSSFNYSRVEEGMRLEQVIELLGPTEEIKGVPFTTREANPDPKRRGCSVVGGDRFFQWPKGYGRPFDGKRVIIGFVDDKVWDKYWWEPMP